jgi:hypothetical protein
MKKTKIFFCLLTFLVFSVFGQAFAKTEEEVMKQYDYSSPQASWNSLQRALKNRDLDGVRIHEWKFIKQPELVSKNFEDFVGNARERWIASIAKEKTSKILEDYRKAPRHSPLYNKTYTEALAGTEVKHRQKQEEEAHLKDLSMFVYVTELWFVLPGRNIRILDLRFIKELNRRKSDRGEGQMCRIEVVNSLTGERGYVETYSFDGLHWWFWPAPYY